MGDDLEQLKTVFRSLVVSSPTQVNVCSLLRDYKSMIGAPVPITKYGYRNPVEFLKEKFSDCFLFTGAPSNPVLTLIVPKSLKHIDKFVQKQRMSSKFNLKRRSVLEENITPIKGCFKATTSSNHLKSSGQSKNKPPSTARDTKEVVRLSNTETRQSVESFKQVNKEYKKPLETSNSLNKTIGKPNFTSDEYKAMINKFNEAFHIPNEIPTKFNKESKNTNETPKQSAVIHNTPSVAACNSSEEVSHYHKPIRNIENIHKSENFDSSDAMKNFFKKRLPQTQYLDEEQNSLGSFDKLDKFMDDDESAIPSTSSGSITKSRHLERLKKEIMQLICDTPEGVWCTELIRLYRERYNRELNFNRFGYTSIISLVYCLENVIQITPVETGDWLLQERSRASPAHLLIRPQVRPRHIRSSNSLHSLTRQHDPEDALPGIDFDPDVFPEDCMQFMDSIDSISLEDFYPGAMVEVIIGEVYSPSHFWFIRVGENYSYAMEDMMDDMTQYYNNEGRDRVLARGAIRVGHYCSSLFERDWHRSIIVKIVDSDTVKVRHVDYGTVDTVPAAQLKPLRRQWAALPAQAGRARLAAVRPPAAGLRWTHAACAAFLALVAERRLVANVVARDAAAAEVLLIDTAGRDDVCIGTQLVRAGHADTRPDSALTTPDVHLYPRFEALENGATPNFAEIRAFLRDGISLDYVHEYRAHVPHVLPALAPSPPCSAPPSPALPPAPSAPSSPALSAPSTPHTPHEDEVSHDPDAVLTSQPELTTSIPVLLPDRPPLSHSVPMFAEDKPNLETKTGRSSAPAAVVQSPFLPTPPARSLLLPTPTSRPPLLPTSGTPVVQTNLSPHTPPYLPRGGTQHDACGPPLYSPPPGITLSLAECETYRMLSQVNPEAAHWFIVGAIGHAMSLQPQSHPPGLPVRASHISQPMPVHHPHQAPQIPMGPPYHSLHMPMHASALHMPPQLPPPHMPLHMPPHIPMNAPNSAFYTQIRAPPGFGF